MPGGQCLRLGLAFHVVDIPQSGLLAQVSSFRLCSGHSGQILNLSNAAHASLPSPRSLVVGARRQQPTRLPRPWDSPGKNPGMGCHFLLQCMKVKSESEVAQACPTICDPMDCSLPGSSVHGIFQARVLEWGAIPFSVHSS